MSDRQAEAEAATSVLKARLRRLLPRAVIDAALPLWLRWRRWQALRHPAGLQPLRLRRLGSEYGGGWVATGLLAAGDVVYSVGVGEEISFDHDLRALVGCSIFGFDPTPRAAEFAARTTLPAGYRFLPWGIAASSGQRRFYFPADPANVSSSLTEDAGTGHIECRFLSLADTMAELGHPAVSLIKLDIEGEEYALFEQWLAGGTRPRFAQMWVEFHPARAGRSRAQTLELMTRLGELGLIALHDGQNGALLLDLAATRVMALLGTGDQQFLVNAN